MYVTISYIIHGDIDYINAYILHGVHSISPFVAVTEHVFTSML